MPINTRPTSKRLEKCHKQEEMQLKAVPASPRISNHAASTSLTPKPQRPLTAYHIFFQIEREFIIQTAAGPNDSDESDHEKIFLRYVPSRYATTKLRPDWYAGPGKRQKRKHRKAHGKIGFHELSNLISNRWATLEETHPDVKRFVVEIAARELDVYKEEMERYKLAERIITSAPAAEKNATKKKKKKDVTKPKASATKMSPPSSPKTSPDVDDANFSTPICTDDEEDDEVDYSISSVTRNGHHIPAPPSESDFSKRKVVDCDEDLSFLDPLFQLPDVEGLSLFKRQRCVSPLAFKLSSQQCDWY